MRDVMNRRARVLAWIALLDGATVIGSVAAACLMPFVALATASALTVSRRIGLLSVAVAWSMNQAIGFGLLGYPTDRATVLRGLVTGLAVIAAYAVARLGRIESGRIGVTRAIAAFLAAFCAYEAVMYAAARWMFGDTWTFAPQYLRLIGVSEAIWFLGLMAAWRIVGLSYRRRDASAFA